MKRGYILALVMFFSLFSSALSTPELSHAALPAAPPASAPGPAARQTAPVEVAALRTQTSRTFRVGNLYVAHVYDHAVNYRDAHGLWQPINTSLVHSALPGAAYQTRANSYIASFPRDLGRGLIRIRSSAGWIAFGFTGVHSHPVIEGNRAIYAVPGARITYTATTTTLKEAISLSGPSSPAQFHYRLQYKAGLSIHQMSTGGVDFLDRSGKLVYAFAPPSMTDAAGASSEHVRLAIRTGAQDSSLTLTASRHWLADPRRSYPVVIDPTTAVLNPSQGCVLNQATPTAASCSSNYVISNASGAQENTLLQFNLSSIPAQSQILDAQLGMYVLSETGATPRVSDLQVTKPWTTAATWNTYDGVHAWTTPGGDYASTENPPDNLAVGPGAGWYYWEPVQLVQDWVNGLIPNDGMMLVVNNTIQPLSPGPVATRRGADSRTHCCVPPTSTVTFSSSGSTQPALTVTYAPWLGVGGASTLVAGVNVANGNLILGPNDVAMEGIGLPLTIGRFYNSLGASSVGAFGSGWLSDVAPDVKLTIHMDGVVDFVGQSGVQAVFVKDCYGYNPEGQLQCRYDAPASVHADLSYDSTSGNYTLTTHETQLKSVFNGNGLLTSEVDRSGNTLTFAYDASNRLSTITDTQGRTTSFSYTSPVSSTLISQITDPAGYTYGYTYDSNKNLTLYTNPASATIQYSYDANHHLTQLTAPNGSQTRFTYDAGGRVTAIKAVTDPSSGAGDTTTYAYNAGSTLLTDPKSHTRTYSYDGRGRVTSLRDGNNNLWQSTWTSSDDLASETTPSGHVTSYGYDAKDNPTTITFPAVNGASMVSSCAFNDATWVYQASSCTDEQGNVTSYGYNSQGLLNSVGDPNGHTATAVYNSNGTLASETDENGHITSYSYFTTGTSIGLPLQDSRPSPLGSIHYSFNNGNLETAVIDGKGQTINYTYDALGRITAATFHNANGTVSSSIGYSYDASGDLLAMTDNTGTTSYTYDALDEMTSKTLPAGPYLSDGHSVDYTYDAVGNLLTKTDTGGTIIYGYDANDQPTNVTDRGGRSYTVGYDVDGNATSIVFPNGVAEAMSYNAVGQLARATATNSSQQTLTSYSYAYTNPTTNAPTYQPYSLTDTQGNTTSLSYDADGQITQAVKRSSSGSTLATYGYTYDAVGNLSSKSLNGASTTFTYNGADELTSSSDGMTYSYDANGDRVSATNGTSTTSISINAAEQIASITPPGGQAVNYTYSGLGEQQRVGAGSTTYQYDAGGIGKQNDTLGATYFTALPDGTLLSETVPSGASAGTYYYLTDGAGSVVAVTNSSGAVSNSYSYDLLGNSTSSTGSVPNPYTFQGGTRDSQTGYIFNDSCFYDPANGQSVGCHDIGRVDPGEDNCGEDESTVRTADVALDPPTPLPYCQGVKKGDKGLAEITWGRGKPFGPGKKEKRLAWHFKFTDAGKALFGKDRVLVWVSYAAVNGKEIQSPYEPDPFRHYRRSGYDWHSTLQNYNIKGDGTGTLHKGDILTLTWSWSATLEGGNTRIFGTDGPYSCIVP